MVKPNFKLINIYTLRLWIGSSNSLQVEKGEKIDELEAVVASLVGHSCFRCSNHLLIYLQEKSFNTDQSLTILASKYL